MSIKEKLKKYYSNNPDALNIAKDLPLEQLTKIGQQVSEGFDIDFSDAKEWMDEVEFALKLAKLKREPKNYPLPKSANIKMPLITNAALQFAARTYPEIIKDKNVVKCEVIGQDLDGSKEKRAKNVSTHMSYQILNQTKDWEIGVDKLLHQLPIIGCLHKKTYFDPITKLNASILCKYNEIVINKDATSTADATRITHILKVTDNDLIEGAAQGIYRDDFVKDIIAMEQNGEATRVKELLEQHRYLDLDGDGYKEPYIVTIHKDTMKVLRIYARYKEKDVILNGAGKLLRIKPCNYFTGYYFIPSPDGSYYAVGFGTLMAHINETVNVIYNQLVDSGQLANLRGGFLDSRIQIPSGTNMNNPGEFKKVKVLGAMELKNGVVPLDYKEPSSVLFQLLGLLIDTAKELSSSTEALQGSQPAQNVPATTMVSLVEQGMKVFNAIQRRLYRSLKEEFIKLYELNKDYLDPNDYKTVLDDQSADAKADYEDKSLDILPVADPNLASDAQRYAKQQALMGILGQPGVDNEEIMKRYVELLDVPNPEKIVPPKDPNNPPPPNPEVIKIQAEIQDMAEKNKLDAERVQIEQQKVAIEAEKSKYEMAKKAADTTHVLAKSEAEDLKIQLADMKLQLDTMKARFQAEKDSRGHAMELHKHAIDIHHKNIELDQTQQEIDNAAKSEAMAKSSDNSSPDNEA